MDEALNVTRSQLFRCQVDAQAEDLGVLETALDGVAPDEISLHEFEPFHVMNESSLWQTLIVGASSSAGIAALRSIIVEIIRSRRIRITIKDGKKDVTFEGPITDAEELRKLADAITLKSPGKGRRSKPLPSVPGDAQPVDRNT